MIWIDYYKDNPLLLLHAVLLYWKPPGLWYMIVKGTARTNLYIETSSKDLWIDYFDTWMLKGQLYIFLRNGLKLMFSYNVEKNE